MHGHMNVKKYLTFLAYGASPFIGVTWPVTLGVRVGGNRPRVLEALIDGWVKLGWGLILVGTNL